MKNKDKLKQEFQKQLDEFAFNLKKYVSDNQNQ